MNHWSNWIGSLLCAAAYVGGCALLGGYLLGKSIRNWRRMK